jgi:hypothetical protein
MKVISDLRELDDSNENSKEVDELGNNLYFEYSKEMEGSIQRSYQTVLLKRWKLLF